jgi:hypothetical protein
MTGSAYFVPTSWVAEIFESGFPFAVWEERLRLLAQGGNLDVHVYLEAETLLSLVEHYVTVLTGTLANPGFRWMAIEQYAPPPRITRLSELLSAKQGWRAVMRDPEFATVSGAEEGGHAPSDEQVFSIILGNPARRTRSGSVETSYAPELLIDAAEAICAFRSEQRSLLNAFKHGSRLPEFSDCSLETVISAAEKSAEAPAGLREQLIAAVPIGPLVPAFWFLETDPEGRRACSEIAGPKGELRLYAVNPERALSHCRFVLEMLKLLFDSARSSSHFGEIAARIGAPLFRGVIETPIRVIIPLTRPPEEGPYTLHAYAARSK